MDDVFSFEDVEEGSSPPRVTTPLPGAPSSNYPRPGTLFGGSPRPVASGVTRGEKKEETRVSLLHVGDPAEVCGGVIGSADNKKFCAVHPSQCKFQLSHSTQKFDLGKDSLYVMSPKKGSVHATLLPRLPRNCLPKHKVLDDLLNDTRPVSMWHVCFNECNAAEESTGHNELGTSSEVAWETDEDPSLETLERANDFKTPKKVRVASVFMKQELYGSRLNALECLIPLSLQDIPRDEGDDSEVQKALREVFVGWQKITQNFTALRKWGRGQDDISFNVQTQLQELVT